MKIIAKYNGGKVKYNDIYDILSMYEGKVQYSDHIYLKVNLVIDKQIVQVHCYDIEDFNNKFVITE